MKSQYCFLTASAVSLFIHLTGAQYRPNVQPDQRTLSELYEAAKEEQATTAQAPLQVLMGGDSGNQGDVIRDSWRQRFPDLPLNLTVDLSKYQDIRIDLAHLEGKAIADVTMLQTLQDFPRWKAENRLMYYKPNHFDDLLNGEKDINGAYLPTGVCKYSSLIM